MPRNYREEKLFINKKEGAYIQVRRVKMSNTATPWDKRYGLVHWSISQNGVVLDTYFTKERAMKAARKLRRELKSK